MDYDLHQSCDVTVCRFAPSSEILRSERRDVGESVSCLIVTNLGISIACCAHGGDGRLRSKRERQLRKREGQAWTMSTAASEGNLDIDSCSTILCHQNSVDIASSHSV